jgi:hypothetical protein
MKSASYKAKNDILEAFCEKDPYGPKVKRHWDWNWSAVKIAWPLGRMTIFGI